MRRFAGILLMLVALLVLTAGAALAVVLGTDNRAETGPHRIRTSAPVVVTSPDVFSWAGPTITLTVVVDRDQRVFIGAANAVDVADYVGSTHRTEITTYSPPWNISANDVLDNGGLRADPGRLDWWVARADGTGSATLTFDLPEQAFSVVVIALGGGSLDGLEVTASYDLEGGFGIGLGLVGLGVGLALFGWIAFQRRPMLRSRPDHDDRRSDLSRRA